MMPIFMLVGSSEVWVYYPFVICHLPFVIWELVIDMNTKRQMTN
jgi:hypothetical protein